MSKPINVEITPRRNEAVERLIKRFAKKVKKERVIEQYREKMFYEKPSERNRRRKKQRKAVLDGLKRKQETN